jgi:GT2 family glycosyltransferase
MPGNESHILVQPYAPLQKVSATGIGCMLVRRRVFESVGMPWFTRTFSPDGLAMDKSDDVHFCEQAANKGFDVWVDTTLESAHEVEMKLDSHSLGRKVEYLEVYR